MIDSEAMVITFSETWLNPNSTSNMIVIPGYSSARVDRTWNENGNVKKGGGVCCYIKNEICFSANEFINHNVSSKNIEICWITLNIPMCRKIVIGTVYRHEACMAVLIDLKKAFDTINHTILVRKLEYMGIKGNLLLWVTNYLHDRSQKTFANDSLSNPQKITCGVPQGSILGPLFFIAYINDIKDCLNDSEFGLYADDTVLFSRSNDKGLLQFKLQDKLNLFYEWSLKNASTINIQKTKYMIFGTRSKLKKLKDTVLTVNG